MRIQSILSQKGTFVATIRPDATAFEASRELATHGVGALLVSADGRTIAGMLSERDVARALAAHGARAADVTVGELMTTDVHTCAPGDTVDALMGMMTSHRVRHLPVVDGSSGEVVGMISIGDVVKHRVGELEHESRTLHEYLESGR